MRGLNMVPWQPDLVLGIPRTVSCRLSNKLTVYPKRCDIRPVDTPNVNGELLLSSFTICQESVCTLLAYILSLPLLRI